MPKMRRCKRHLSRITRHIHYTHIIDHTPDVIIWHKIDVDLFGSIEFESIFSFYIVENYNVCAAIVVDAHRHTNKYVRYGTVHTMPPFAGNTIFGFLYKKKNGFCLIVSAIGGAARSRIYFVYDFAL